MPTEPRTVTVNRAAWTTPEPIPDGWLIANAPRPIAGRITWTGDFLHGIFYAACPPDIPGALESWTRDDAWLVTFTDNAEIERRVMAELAAHGYASPEDISATVAEIAADMQLPWHEPACA